MLFLCNFYTHCIHFADRNFRMLNAKPKNLKPREIRLGNINLFFLFNLLVSHSSLNFVLLNKILILS